MDFIIKCSGHCKTDFQRLRGFPSDSTGLAGEGSQDIHLFHFPRLASLEKPRLQVDLWLAVFPHLRQNFSCELAVWEIS